ncbi:tetratricopeptide repeat-containing sulfotransferase family protein [Microbulbifer hainanensis]|uniref:tetratricopeptide repeat-containing sulfotransferase family protein n=1 Tax=Microbulbifer hainanensis TaxID=2735675 RepID=UPI00186852AF|nr:sulfotransferase [Microbulbifer hainanensis]
MISAKKFNEKLSGARRLLSTKHFSEAEAVFLELLNLGQEQELLLRELVRLYWEWGKADQAISSLEKLIRLAPNELGFYLDLANICEQAGDLEKSAESYRQLLQRKPDLPNTWYNLARLLKRLGRSSEALAAYQESLRYNVSRPEEVYNNIAVIFSEMRQESKAIAALVKSIEINSAYISARFNLGGIYEESGDPEKALEQYKKILSLDPDCFPALCRIANMPRGSIDIDWLLIEIQKALEKPSVETRVREELLFSKGKLFDECRKFSEAFKAFRDANELGRRRFPAYSKVEHEKKIEEIINVFNRDWFSNLKGCSSLAPVFICGMYRSGSTLVEQILSGHPRVTAGGELDYFPTIGMDRLLASADTGTRDEYIQSAASGYLDYLAQRFESASQVTDKRPDNYLNLGVIKTLFPQAKVIWTRRGLLDNCLSIYFQYLGGDMNYSVDLDFIGHYYTQQCKLMEHWCSLFPETIYPISYENLVDFPDREVRALLEFLGLEWNSTCLDFSNRDNYVKTASIWQVRESVHKRAKSRHEHYTTFIGVLDKYKD